MASAPAAKNSSAIGGDAVAAGGVLAVDDRRVELQLRPQARQLLQQDRPAGPADHVADVEDAQLEELSGGRYGKSGGSSTGRQPASVTTSSSGTSVSSAGTASTSWHAKAKPARTGAPPAAAMAAKVMS